MVRIRFSCLIMSDCLSSCYVPGINEVSWAVDASVLAGFTWERFMKAIKVRLLSRSVHKGKFLGFLIRGTLLRTFDLADSSLAGAGDITLVVQNSELSDTELEVALAQKREELQHLLHVAAPDDVESYYLRLARELAYTSDKIEGTTIEADESKVFLQAFRNEVPPELADPDHIELRKHMLAIVDIVYTMKDQPLTSINSEYMLALHRALDVSHMREQDKGAYRTVEVTIAGATNPGFTRAADVPRAVDAMLVELHTMSNHPDPLYVAASLHYHFVQIHPFADGNGRVGRLLMNTVLLQRGYPPVCIHPNIRDTYFLSLRVARRVERGALALPTGTRTAYDLLKRILAECALRSVEIGSHMLSLHAPLG